MYSIGEKVDDMIIQSYEGMTENYVKLFRVKCAICGAEKIIQYSRLNSHKCTFHNVKTCNYCHYADKNIGLTINDYTIVKRLNKQYKTSAYYLARCNVCGMEFETTNRIDCNGNYEKGNVRWATCKEQVLNQRRNYEKSQINRMVKGIY